MVRRGRHFLGLAAALLLASMPAIAQMPESVGGGYPTGNANTQVQQGGQPNAGSALPGSASGYSATSGMQGSFGTPSGGISGANGVQSSTSLPIAVGDLLDIAVFDTPDLSSRLRVNSRGDILLPLAGYVHVLGMLPPEAAQAVAAKLVEARLMLQPHVTVLIMEYSSRGVTMAGEIRTPGVYQLLGPRSLLDMVTQAGGLGENASKVISIIHRNDPTKIITIRMNVSMPTPESIAAESYPIQAGDTIFVARSGIVYVVGDLKTPGGFQVEHNERLTLLDAIALAGGPTPTSKLGDARLIRKGDRGREELQVDLKKLLYGSGPDMLLQDGDILFVPVSQRKIYTQTAIQTAIGAASQYVLFHETTN